MILKGQRGRLRRAAAGRGYDCSASLFRKRLDRELQLGLGVGGNLDCR